MKDALLPKSCISFYILLITFRNSCIPCVTESRDPGNNHNSAGPFEFRVVKNKKNTS